MKIILVNATSVVTEIVTSIAAYTYMIKTVSWTVILLLVPPLFGSLSTRKQLYTISATLALSKGIFKLLANTKNHLAVKKSIHFEL